MSHDRDAVRVNLVKGELAGGRHVLARPSNHAQQPCRITRIRYSYWLSWTWFASGRQAVPYLWRAKGLEETRRQLWRFEMRVRDDEVRIFRARDVD